MPPVPMHSRIPRHTSGSLFRRFRFHPLACVRLCCFSPSQSSSPPVALVLAVISSSVFVDPCDHLYLWSFMFMSALPSLGFIFTFAVLFTFSCVVRTRSCRLHSPLHSPVLVFTFARVHVSCCSQSRSPSLLLENPAVLSHTAKAQHLRHFALHLFCGSGFGSKRRCLVTKRREGVGSQVGEWGGPVNENKR